MIQYGFQRLALLGSAGYQRAELPLDDAVSLIAPNNTGKTSLINALQFLLIIDKRRMDFGAHDVEKSRRFYFPTNSSYILLEVSLPSTGTLVLGCVGKGVSNDFEYFYYKGPLNVEEFKQDNGNLVAQPNLVTQLAQHGRLVNLCSQSEFRDLIYGGRRSKNRVRNEFSVFQLEYVGDAEAFQQVLTRTLKLDKLTSANVKEYLLQIFERDLPDASIDFKQEWDKAFSEVDADRVQYLAARRQCQRIISLEEHFEERLILRGKLLDWQPRIDTALLKWDQYHKDQAKALSSQKNTVENERRSLSSRDQKLVRAQEALRQEKRVLHNDTDRCNELDREFALVSFRTDIEQQLEGVQKQRDQQITLINQTESRSHKAISQELLARQKAHDQLLREKSTLSDNLFLHLKSVLNDSDLHRLNRVIAKDVMVTDPSSFNVSGQALANFLQHQQPDSFEIPGLSIHLERFSDQYQQRTKADIEEDIADTELSIRNLKQQLPIAESLEAANELKHELEKQVRDLEQSLNRYDELQKLTAESESRANRLLGVDKEIEQIDGELARSEQLRNELDARFSELTRAEQDLERAYQSIDQNRNRRIDSGPPFSHLDGLENYPWLAEPDWPLESLSKKLSDYLDECKKLVELDRQLQSIRSQLHAEGLTKFQYSESEDKELKGIIGFFHSLDQEQEAIEKKARSAVVSVTTSLKELRSGLASFQSRMRDFNRLIGHRQLSDLKTFKIEAESERHLVHAIDVLISTAAQVDTGDSFELFSQASVLDDEQLTRAKQILIDEGNARRGLRVSDLFRIIFVVGKEDQADERFEDIDSAASNGTVLMAKLVTGLAMLHLMQDKRHNVRGICYLDEALALDGKNQGSLIEAAKEFGFALIFASPAPLTTARYCVPIHHHQGKNYINRESWQVIEPLDTAV